MPTDADDDAPRWEVFGERTVYDNPWVRVVRVDVRPPDGQRFEHHVIRLQRVVMALVVSADRTKVLMLRRHRFVTGQIGWELPGGIVDAGESGVEAATRETVEETGYRPEGGRLLAAFQPMIGMVDTPHEVYVFDEGSLVGTPTDAVEAGIVDWIPLADAVKLIDQGEVLGSGSIIGLLRYIATEAP